MPRPCADSCTSTHFSVGALVSDQMRLRTESSRISAPPPGIDWRPASLQPRDHVAHRPLRDLLEEVDLGRRERVEVDRRKGLPDVPEHLLVEGERQLRVHAALEQHARPAEVDRLLDLLADLLVREDVRLGVLGRGPVEGAELAAVDADVRVVDVAVDDVGRDRRDRSCRLRIVVRRGAEGEEVALLEQRHGVGGGQALAREGAVENAVGRARAHAGILARRTQRKRSGRARNESLFRGQPVEEGQALEIAGVELEVEGVAQVVLDDRRMRGPRRPTPPRPWPGSRAGGFVGAPEDAPRPRASPPLAHRPEREHEGVAGEGPPLGRQVQHDVAVQPRLQGRVADDEAGVGLAASVAVLGRRGRSTRFRRIRVSAAEVRDAGSSATERIFSRETSETSRTERTSEEAAMPRPGTTFSPGIRWYSIEGISPTSASPAASLAAQTEGTSRETETPGRRIVEQAPRQGPGVQEVDDGDAEHRMSSRAQRGSLSSSGSLGAAPSG